MVASKRGKSKMKRIVCIVMAVILALGLWGCAPQGEPDENAQGKIAMGLEFFVAVKGDGTVVAAGNNDYGQCNVEDWRDIKQVAAVTFAAADALGKRNMKRLTYSIMAVIADVR